MQTPNTELSNSIKKQVYIIASGFFIAFSGAIILCNANTLSGSDPKTTSTKNTGYAILALGVSMAMLAGGHLLWVQNKESVKKFFSSCLPRENKNNESRHPLIP